MAGLPNITGEISVPYDDDTSLFGELAARTIKGALYIPSTGFRQGTSGSGSYNFGTGIAMSASLSNPVYGNSMTVTPVSQSTLYVIKY